jgi:CubicO group peptidase (beta-lactamase class C family)
MKKLGILFLLFPLALQAQQKHLTLPQLKDSIQKIVKAEHIVGLMLGITARDSVIFSGGFGYADLENKRKVDAKTLFRMGSNTKMLVSLAILKLQSEGKINLNDEVRKIAPEVPIQNAWEADHPVRVVHLLEHTSGFDDIKLNRMYSLKKHETTGKAAMLVHAPSMICRWQPGERHAYCNPNYAILGYLIEKITGKPYRDYLQDSIMAPLGMNNSNLNTFSQLPNDVKEYTYRNGKVQKVPSVTLMSGAPGALWSSSDDLIKLLQMYLHNGSPVFSENIIKEMETPRNWLGVKEGLNSGYALGNYYGNYLGKFGFRGHTGLVGTCTSDFFYNRQLGLGYVIATNSNSRTRSIEKLVLDFLEQDFPEQKRIAQPLDQKAIQPFLGFYQFESPRNEIGRIMDELSNAFNIYIKNDTLIMQSFFGEKTKLIQTAPFLFRRANENIATIAFTKNAKGKRVLSWVGLYFEKNSLAWGVTWRTAILFMAAMIVLSGLMALVSLIGAFFKKVAWNKIPGRFLAISALVLLGYVMNLLTEKQTFSYALYKFRTINAETVLIFIGTAFWGLAGLISMYLAYRAIQLKNRWGAWFWALAYLSMTGLALIFWSYGLIGLRVWAM